jgi:hypothetical protein
MGKMKRGPRTSPTKMQPGGERQSVPLFDEPNTHSAGDFRKPPSPLSPSTDWTSTQIQGSPNTDLRVWVDQGASPAKDPSEIRFWRTTITQDGRGNRTFDTRVSRDVPPDTPREAACSGSASFTGRGTPRDWMHTDFEPRNGKGLNCNSTEYEDGSASFLWFETVLPSSRGRKQFGALFTSPLRLAVLLITLTALITATYLFVAR